MRVIHPVNNSRDEVITPVNNSRDEVIAPRFNTGRRLLP